MYYELYELNHAALSPWRAAADATRLYFKNPLNPLAHTTFGKSLAAGSELFERMTRRYGKPEFGLDTTTVGGSKVSVREEIVWERSFCRLVHFARALPRGRRNDPKVLVVAPMSGHYATLLRGTVEALLPNHDVYITDWVDARMVPLADGPFDLDDYVDYVVSMLHFLGGDTHVLAVCQPAVPVFAAVALMEEDDDPYAPLSMTLMGGPIDTQENPTAVNDLAKQHDIGWFRHNVIMRVPFPHPGFMREVYPGFLQLTGFMSMNLDRHMTAHHDYFHHLVQGDGDSAEKHRDFYDEYLAVMDLTAEFYLQTLEKVFMHHDLPNGTFMHRDRLVNPAAIRRTALLTVEGEKDDISGVGQTKAAHRLAVNLPDDKRSHYEQPGVGHYGVFNGSRFRSEICPRIADFIQTHEQSSRRRPAAGSGASQAAPAAPTAPAMAVVETPAAALASAVAALSGLATAGPDGEADDLTRIMGIGPRLAAQLNEMGIWHFRQLAALSDAAIDELDHAIAFPGRIRRDDWVGQAKALGGMADVDA